MGYQVKICDQKTQIDSITKIFKPDLFIFDTNFGGYITGDIAAVLKKENQHIPLILLVPSNVKEKTRNQIVVQSLCDDFLALPFDQTDLYGKVTSLIESDNLPSTIFMEKLGSEQENEEARSSEKKEMIKGVVDCKSIGGLLFTLLRMRKSGDLLVRGEKRKLKARLRNDQLIEVFSTYIREDSFGHFLMDLRRISLKEHLSALRKSKEKKLLEGEILVRMDILSRQELHDYLSRHKLKKFLRLFSEPWKKADFRFFPNRETIQNASMQPMHIRKLLKLGLFKVANSDDLVDAFKLNGNKNRQVMVDGKVDEIGSMLSLNEEELEIARWLHAKSITDIKKYYPDQYNKVLRLLLLMMVCKTARMEDPNSPNSELSL